MTGAVLVVDDEANIRRMLAGLLQAAGYRVTGAPDGRNGLTELENEEADVVLLDLLLPGDDGITILGRMVERHPDVPVVMMSGRATLGDAVQATKLGAFHFIEKPLSPDAVLLTINSALALRRARAQTRALSAELTAGQHLIGSSIALRGIRELIATIAPTDARVLITGESGTGKELVAGALHAQSRRSEGPFVRINSAAIPRELIESEMFGHERGAFTGAHQARRGKLELANSGTLFLDEVADLNAEAQAKLLRAIDTGEYQRVGGQRTAKVDVRVLAATNRDLRNEVLAGRFRDDLFYRLNVVPIQVPPLRDRLSDLPELVTYFLQRYHQRTGALPPIITEVALTLLRRYRWPGNVRELANLCERIAILHPAQLITDRELRRMLPDVADDTGPDERPLHVRLDDYERSLILDALNDAAGNVTDAARRLSTDRPNLYRRMRRLGIDR
ncbi:MAG: sigma-54-dependent transcriptional regulator [Longimicrobiales bacterium]